MNEQLIVKNVRKYKETLVREGFGPKKADENAFFGSLEPVLRKQHLIWICDLIVHYVEQNQRDLVILWYGNLQMAMAYEEEFTFEEMRQDNVLG